MMDAPDFSRRHLDVMWTSGELASRCDPAVAGPLFDEAEAMLEQVSRRYTRFDPTSVLERFNDAGGGEPSDELAEILQLAERAWHDTGGRFDIGLGAELIAEGYDRDADLLPPPTQEDLDPDGRLELARATAYIILQPRTIAPVSFGDDGTARIREGSRIDLGGFVKGWAADRACAILARAGRSCAVNLGGDIAIHVEPGEADWPIGLYLPGGEAELELTSCGVATSGPGVKQWHLATESGGRLAHHIIDPRTGHSSTSDISRLTVIAATCAEAEIWTKALLLAGAQAAVAEANARNLMAVIIGLDGEVALTAGLAG